MLCVVCMVSMGWIICLGHFKINRCLKKKLRKSILDKCDFDVNWYRFIINTMYSYSIMAKANADQSRYFLTHLYFSSNWLSGARGRTEKPFYTKIARDDKSQKLYYKYRVCFNIQHQSPHHEKWWKKRTIKYYQKLSNFWPKLMKIIPLWLQTCDAFKITIKNGIC